MVHYSQITVNDNLPLAGLIRAVFEEHGAHRHQGTIYQDPTTDRLHELFQTEGACCWVGKDGPAYAGCCGIYPTPGLPIGCVELVKFYVSPSFRGKGVGKTLLARSLKTAREFGYDQIYLESLPEFGKAVGLYEKLGFIKLRAPLGNSGHYGCSIWMLKRL